MSEQVSIIGEEQSVAQHTSGMPSAGTILRTAREAQGVHIDTLAVAMKVPVRKLEALEADRYDLLPDTVFVRALAASICRTLKIDSAPVLEKLPSNTAPRIRTDESGINTPFRVSGDGVGSTFFAQLSKPVVLAVLALLVGMLVIVFFPFGSSTEIFGDIKSDGTSVTSVVPQTQTMDNLPVQAGDTVPVLSSSLSMSIPSEPVAATEQLAPANAPEVAPINDLIRFTAKGSSWIQVVDAKGVTQLNKTLGDGEVASANGAVPLSVVIGRADSTEVQWRGKPFDLAQVSKNNVARFEVK